MVTLHGGSGDDVERATGTGTLVRLVAEAGHNRVTVSEPRLVEIDLSASRVGVHLDAARGLVDGIGRTRLHLAPGSRLSVHGTRFSDRLVGTGGDDTLVGGDGDDVIDAGAGNDTIQPGPGRGNLVQAGRGHDRVVGDPSLRPRGHDVVHAGPGPDLVHVDGSAEVYGGPVADTSAAASSPVPGNGCTEARATTAWWSPSPAVSRAIRGTTSCSTSHDTGWTRTGRGCRSRVFSPTSPSMRSGPPRGGRSTARRSPTSSPSTTRSPINRS